MTQLVKWHESQHWQVNLGTTDIDCCTYGGYAPISAFEPMLNYLNALLRKPTLTGGLEHELAIMNNERTDQGWSSGQVDSMKIRYKALYRDNQIVSWLVNGSDLNELTIEDAQAFHRQYYDCPNMTIIMVGGLPEAEAVSMVMRAFPLSTTTVARPVRQEPRMLINPRPRTNIIRKTGDQRKRSNNPLSVTLSWFWIVPPGGDDAIQVTIDCLEQLFEERIREKWTLNYGASTEFASHEDHRRVEIETTVSPDYEHRVRRLFIHTLRDADAVVAELPERKAAYRRSHDVYDPDVQTTLESAVNDLVSKNHIRTLAESIAAYEAVTEHDVRRVLAEILCPERYFLEVEET